MKKYLIVLSLFLFPVIVSAQGFGQDLYYGLQDNSGVTELQEFLTDQGHYSGPITGNFFSLTLSAVKRFQVANSISQTGYFGPLSRTRANGLLSASGVSQKEIATENGTITPASTTAPKTTTDVVNSLMEQIKILQQQLAVLQQQQATLQQQTQTLQQIQQQTASTPIPAPAPIPTTPPDTQAPKVTIHYASQGDSQVSWPDPNFPGYGSTHKNCTQCLVIMTDEPSIISVSYFDYTDLVASLSGARKTLWETPETNARTQAVDEQLQAEPQRLLTFTDDLKKEHVIQYQSLNLLSSVDYIYKFEAQDASGNVYKQQFTGSYGLPLNWSINQKMSK